MRTYKDFPANIIKKLVWHVYPRKGIVMVNGGQRYELKELKKIDLNTRLSFPPELFTTIDKSK